MVQVWGHDRFFRYVRAEKLTTEIRVVIARKPKRATSRTYLPAWVKFGLGQLVLQQRGAEGLEEGTIDGVALRIVLGVPLHADSECRRVGDADGLDRAVFGDAFDDDPLAWLENALAVQGVHADRVPSHQLGKQAVRGQT